MRFFVAVVFVLAVAPSFHSSVSEVRAGYWLSSSGHYSPLSSIEASLYTHLYYYSVSLDPSDWTIALPSPALIHLLSTFSATLKSENPSVKTLLSIATEEDRSDVTNAAFSAMAADPALRSAFVDSAIHLASTHSFDGLDLAWRFPSSSSDMANLGVLLSEWRARSALLLTATVYFSDHLFDGSESNLDYPIDAIAENLDWINVLCFGYRKNSMVAAGDAALIDRTSHSSTSYSIGSWIDSGVSSEKLVMGIPLFGRSWYLKNKEKNEPGARVVAAGPRQKLSNQSGIMAYFEIEQNLKEGSSTLAHDTLSGFAYFHNGGLWVSFDDPQVVEEKIKFARKKALLGYFLYPVSFDNSNHTISKQALDAWERYHTLNSFDIEDRYGEAESPEGTFSVDEAPYQMEDMSDSLGCFQTISAFFSGLVLSMLFLTLLCTD